MRKFASSAIGLVLFISGCSLMAAQAPSPTSTRMPTGFLSPYHTHTPQSATPIAIFEVTIPVTPSPTPTPFLHVITNDDTMLGLALRYGIKLEDLKAANPGVNPNAMSVGSKLVIPLNGIIVESVPTPTALPVQTSLPVCIETGDGSAWCIVGIRNVTESSLENLSAWVGLYDSQGENFVSQVAYAPLDILKPGDMMPLMAYFPAPLPDKYVARCEVLSALPVLAGDPRYLDAQVKTSAVEIIPAGNLATVTGQLLLPKGTATPSQVWVLVVAYDKENNIVGMRKWKSAGDTKFNTTVYSLGGVISHLEILAEARP